MKYATAMFWIAVTYGIGYLPAQIMTLIGGAF